MKKTLQLFTLLAVWFVNAQDFTVDNISYTITTAGSEVEVQGTTLATVVVPDTVDDNGTTYTVTAIGVNAFKNNVAITSVELPSTVTTIKNEAFRGMTSLTTVSFTTVSGVTSIGHRGFLQSAALVDVGGNATGLFSVLETITGNGAFNTTNLQNTVVVSNLTSTGTNVFRENDQLKGVDLSGSTGLTTLNTNFFLNNDLLETITLPEGLQEFGNSSVSGQIALTSIVIPSTVTTYGTSVFANCTSLVDVEVKNPTPATITSGVFTNYSTATLTVPSGAKAAYEAADVWKDFGTITDGTTLSNNNVIATEDVYVYPNPVKDVVNIETTSENPKVNLYDITGRLLLTQNGNQVNVASLPSGVYILKITENKKDFVKRIVKQ